MKTLIITFLILSACNSQTDNKQIIDQKVDNYFVSDIESINEYYIIRLKKGEHFYKVLASKSKSNICKKIEVNKEYKFSLSSIWSNTITLEDGRSFKSPINVDCKEFDGVGKICLEKDSNYIRDLFKIDNIKEICAFK